MPAQNDMGSEYGGPGRYLISVQGEVPGSWVNRLGSMQIEQSEERPGITTLSGVVTDQSELAGILGALQSLRLPLLSLQRLDETDRKEI